MNIYIIIILIIILIFILFNNIDNFININDNITINPIKLTDKMLLDLPIFNKKYDYIIPFGHFCIVKHTLINLGLKYEALPFDYIFSDIYNINECLKNNFIDFLDKKYYIIKYVDNNRYITYHDKYEKIIFYHHNLSDDNIYKSFQRRVDRILSINSNENDCKLYISCTFNYDGPKNKYNYMNIINIFNEYKKNIKNMNYLFIVLSVIKNEERKIDLIISEKYEDDSSITILHLYSSIENDGLIYKDIQDQELLLSIFKKIQLSDKNILKTEKN